MSWLTYMLPALLLYCQPLHLPAVLRQLGIINNSTRLAGTSGGAISSVLACVNLPVQAQMLNLLALTTAGRAAPVGEALRADPVRASLSGVLAGASVQQCSGRLWVSVTEATPSNQPDVNVLLNSSWSSADQLAAAAAASSYLPGLSGPSATTQLPDLPARAFYDGGFTQMLPCPPGEMRASLRIWCGFTQNMTGASLGL